MAVSAPWGRQPGTPTESGRLGERPLAALTATGADEHLDEVSYIESEELA
jgi:hypothetical protein